MKQLFKRLIITMLLSMIFITSTFALDFTDVNDSDWFAPYIDLLVDMGVINGYTDNTFRPSNSVSYGEVAKMLCTFAGEEEGETTNSHWAEGYVNKAYELGWFSEYPNDFNAEVSRYVIVNAVFNMEGYELDSEYLNPFSDIDDAMATTMYKLGIVTGSSVGNNVVFLADASVKRSEICTILNRVVTSKEESTVVYEYILPKAEKPNSDGEFTREYFDSVILYMMAQDIESFEIDFTGMSFDDLKASGVDSLASESFLYIKCSYGELGGFYENINCGFSGNSTNSKLTITIFDKDCTNEELYGYKADFINSINVLVASTFENGFLSEDDSNYDKALYFYRWCAYNLQYDESLAALSANGYGALYNKTAVCQGYVAVFNALCKAVGIDVIGVCNESQTHIFSYANLDGTWLYIDPTYGDPTPDRGENYCNENYFGLTFDEITRTHIIDELFM